MEISRELLEQKNHELANLLTVVSIEDRPAILEKLNALSSLQHSYEHICSQFEALFAPQQSSVELEVTDGAISEHYLNLKKAVSAGLVAVEKPIHISFPGLQLPTFTGDVKRNGYLRNRTIARLFYDMANIQAGNRRLLFTKTGADEYTLEVYSEISDLPERNDAFSRRLPPFQFSYCGIDIGETIAYAFDPEIVCTVYDDKHVLFNGETFTLSALAQKIRNTTTMLQGPRYFTYHGELLSELRSRMEGRSR